MNGNKSAEVRQYLAANPDVGPKEVAKALSKLGISAAYVSTIKSKMKTQSSSAAKGSGAKRGRPAKVRGGNELAPVVAAASFIKQCGGIDAARRAFKAAEHILAAGS